ncbi:MAG TPA: Bax inhibitor-1/YccA family protein [Micromonosporaceae bacterium]
MQSSNPVLGRLRDAARQERYGIYPAQQPTGYDQYGYPQSPVVQPAVARPMTIDDVVTRSVALLLVTGVFAAFSWIFLTGPITALATIGSSIAGLVLVLVISFKRITNPAVISAYAAVEGILLGVVSRVFEDAYSGIVIQAVVGTFGVFFGMAALYKFRVLRATPKFARFVLGALIGVVALGLVNWVLAMFGHNPGLVYYGPGQSSGLAIVFAIACIAIGALTFILDFDAIEQGIRYGLPEKYAWYCAFGILVGLIYLYWYILRLLGYLRR